MKPLVLTVPDAQATLLAHLGNDDLARLISQLPEFADCLVQVDGAIPSYVCWNGYRSDKRGDFAWLTTEETADATP